LHKKPTQVNGLRHVTCANLLEYLDTAPSEPHNPSGCVGFC